MKESANTTDFNSEKLLSIIANQQQSIQEKDSTIQNQSIQIEALRHKLQLALAKSYGKKSEQATGQVELFDEAELPEQQTEPEAETTSVPAHTCTKPKRKPLPKDLPRVQSCT